MGIARVGIAALCLLACVAASSASADEPLGVLLEAGVTSDDNVTRSRGANRLSDTSFVARLSKNHVIALTDRSRLSLTGVAMAERFSRYAGLSHVSAEVQGEIQYRESGEFAAPTFGIFGHAAAEAYDSRLRDGYRYAAGVRVLQPLTDRLEVFGALSHHVRDGKSRVFDNRFYAARFNADYALSAKSTLYLGGEVRRGHVVSSARPALDFIDIAEAIVADDAFSDPDLRAYRLKARTGIATLGFNLSLRDDQSLDLSLRWIRSTALSRPGYPGAEAVRYEGFQAGIAYLVRF